MMLEPLCTGGPALPSHFEGKIWLHSTQFWLEFVSVSYIILGHLVYLLDLLSNWEREEVKSWSVGRIRMNRSSKRTRRCLSTFFAPTSWLLLENSTCLRENLHVVHLVSGSGLEGHTTSSQGRSHARDEACEERLCEKHSPSNFRQARLAKYL